MFQIVWSSESRDDLLNLVEYVAKRNPLAARNLTNGIEQSVVHLVDHPYLFRSGRVPGTREIVVHPNYIVIYQVAEGLIKVLRVLHARRQYP